MDEPTDPTAATTTLTVAEVAALAGTTPERVALLAAHGLAPAPEAGYTSGDVHRIRLLEAVTTAGVPLEALVIGMTTGRLDFDAYHELHRDPGPASPRTYAAFGAEADPDGTTLPAFMAATGLAQPDADARLPLDEEAMVGRWLDLVRSVDDPELAVRVVRLFAEASRRATAAAMEVYVEAASRLGPDPASVDPEDYARLLEPWSHLARAMPSLAGWLTERHLRRAIDAFSAESSEQILAAEGIVPARAVAPPGIAFVDLTGYTRTTQELGDEAAAGLSLRLGELARTHAERHGGRLVKLLGDGALIQLPDGVTAVRATLDLLAALPDAGLPGGHAGISAGPVIEREGDVFGRTVNLAARLSDHAPDGAVYVTEAVAADLAGAGLQAEPAGTADLQGIGPVALTRVVR